MRIAFTLSLTFALSSSFAKSNWKPLFDGRTWAGWHIAGAQNYWKIESDSSIAGYSITSTPYTMVFTDKKDFNEFTIKYQYRLKAGCSGFFFRSKEQPGGELVAGMQIEAKYLSSGHSEVGSLYCHKCNDNSGTEQWNGWVDPHNETFSDAMIKPGLDTYQQVYLTVKRPYIYVNVNGTQSVGETEQAKITAGAKPPRNYTNISVINTPGQFGLQIHGGQTQMDVRFKDIQILEGCNDSTSVNYDGKWVPGTSNKHPAFYQNNGTCTGTGIEPDKARNGLYFGKMTPSGNGLELEIKYPGAHSLDIINLDGKIVFTGSAPSAHLYHVRKRLDAGIYLARIVVDGKSASRKIVIP